MHGVLHSNFRNGASMKFPLTDQSVLQIQRRLGPIFTKYTWSSLIHWEPQLSKFIHSPEISGYRLGHTWLVYINSLVALFGFMAFTYSLSDSNLEIPDAAPRPSDTLLTFSMLVYMCAMAGITGFGSVLLEHQDECADAFNMALSLDARFKSTFPVTINAQEAKYSDRMIRLACYPPLLIPFLFVVTLFHPLDPVHVFLERVLEVKVDFNTQTFLLACVEFYGVLCYLAVVTIVILMGTVSTMVSLYWMDVTMPVIITPDKRKKGKYTIQTENGREYEEDRIIWVYRSLQVFMTIPNTIVSRSKYVVHACAMQNVWVISAFVLIRYNREMLDGSPMGLTMVAIFVAAFVIGTAVYYVECLFLDYMENQWTSYKAVLLAKTCRKCILYKTARSFRPVSLQVGGMFYNVNKTTYTEWIDVGINNLTTLLVSA